MRTDKKVADNAVLVVYDGQINEWNVRRSCKRGENPELDSLAFIKNGMIYINESIATRYGLKIIVVGDGDYPAPTR